jgi:hypothetical protein
LRDGDAPLFCQKLFADGSSLQQYAYYHDRLKTDVFILLQRAYLRLQMRFFLLEKKIRKTGVWLSTAKH